MIKDDADGFLKYLTLIWPMRCLFLTASDSVLDGMQVGRMGCVPVCGHNGKNCNVSFLQPSLPVQVQGVILPRLLWPLTIYEIGLPTVEGLEKKVNRCIRSWLGLPPGM